MKPPDQLRDEWERWLAIAITIALFLTLPINAQSQQPSPRIGITKSNPPQEKSARSTQLIETDQRGSEKSPFVIQVIPTPKTDKEAEQQRKDHEEKARNEYLLIGLNILLVLFTCTLAIYTAKLWRATDKLVRGAQDTAERQLRAYVFVDRAEIGGLNSWLTPVAHLVVKNSGQTPAYDLTEMGGIAMGESFETLPPPTGSHRMSRASLPAGAVTDQVQRAPRPLVPEEIDALRDGKLTTDLLITKGNKAIFARARFGSRFPRSFVIATSCECSIGSIRSYSFCPFQQFLAQI